MTELSLEELEKQPVVLTLTLNNSQPIELSAFLGAFTSLAREYQESLRDNPDFDGEASIYVKEVRAGSIIADLIPVVAATLPVLATQAEQVWQAVEFVRKWGERISSLASGVVPESFKKSDLKSFFNAVEAIARDPNGTALLEAATFHDGKRDVKAAFKFNTADAQKVEKTIDIELRRIESEVKDVFYRVLMIFTRSDIKDAPKDKRSGERVIITEIFSRDLPIIYASEMAEQRVKHEIREAPDNIFKKGFVVDVLVLRRLDRPFVYKLMNIHEVIDLPDDE